MQKLIPLKQKNDDLKSEIQTLQIRLDEKDIMYRAKVDELVIKDREIERLESQNNLECYSSEDSDLSQNDDSSEETKDASTVIMGSSFDNSANNRSRMSNNSNQKTKNSMAKSIDSGLESEANKLRDFTESLDSLHVPMSVNETASTQARQEMLQFAEKALAEKRAIATQLDLLKDKQRKMRQKLATKEDKIESLMGKLATN